MIKKEDILTLHFFDYKQAFTGSYHEMRYRFIKEEHEIEEGKKEAVLLVACWKGPNAYDHTDESEITRKEFEFSEEGKEKAVEWLNDMYTER